MTRCAGYIEPTEQTKLGELASRERQLARALVDSKDDSLPVLRRIMEHGARADALEARMKAMRGY